MRHFLDMIEVARKYKVAAQYEHGPDFQKPETQEAWFKMAQECQPFVFTINEKDFKDHHLLNENVSPFGETDTAKLMGAPFEVFSIEFTTGPVMSLRGKGSGEYLFVHCLMCIETKPGQFNFYGLLSSDPYSGLEGRVIKLKDVSKTVNAVLDYMEKMKVGSEAVRERVKLGHGNNKRTHTIRRIIHVAPKSELQRFSIGHRNIDWTHRFLVRGHWRKIDGHALGKDRAGNYAVVGHTWVTEHERGPEDKPLVVKTRAVNL